MTNAIDLSELARRESEQIEWKESVADFDDVVETLSAFANDLSNLGGGYVVCGAKEDKDADGFPCIDLTGLTASRLKEIEGIVITRCRDRVFPSIAPLVQELPAKSPDRRILVFVQPATAQAHHFRRRDEAGKYFVRVARSTIEARNGILRDLLVRKGQLEPWDRRPCPSATLGDIDLLALRDGLQRMGVFSPERGVEPYLSDTLQLSPFVPPLFWREPLGGALRPRNFALLLFGRDPQRFIPGAFSIFSIYPGVDRAEPHAERHEVGGTLVDQARRLRELLDVQSYTVFDKTDMSAPNALKYPLRALYEATGNALAHRDYEVPDPTRITVFSGRIEVVSPGPLPLGVDPVEFREGRSGPKWRNQALAWFLSKLQLAQAEGQGIPTILRVMRDEGCPPPTLEANDVRVLCSLPAHPRHAILKELRDAEQALALGELKRADAVVTGILERDSLNSRALQLFAEVHQALGDPAPLYGRMKELVAHWGAVPPSVLVQASEALVSQEHPPDEYLDLARQMLAVASRGRLEEREARRVALGMMRARDHQGALAIVERQFADHPELRRSASLLQIRGDALLNLAKRCRQTGRDRQLPRATRDRAWREMATYLDEAERVLKEALSLSVEPMMTGFIRKNLDYLAELRPDGSRRSHGR